MEVLVLKNQFVEPARPYRGAELEDGCVHVVPPAHAVGRERVRAATPDRQVGAVQMVVAHRQDVVVAHLPVEPTEQVGVRRAERLLAEAAGDRVVVLLQNRDEPLRRVGADAGDAHGVDPDVRAGVRRISILVLPGHEEMQPVLDDRAAERPAPLVLFEAAERQAALVVPDEALVLMIEEGRTADCVRAAFGDRVDEAACEAALAYVEPRLKRSLLTAPSIWMLLKRSFCPPIDDLVT